MSQNAEVSMSLRVTAAQNEKLLKLADVTATSRSWVLRKLIEDSELVAAPLFVAKRENR